MRAQKMEIYRKYYINHTDKRLKNDTMDRILYAHDRTNDDLSKSTYLIIDQLFGIYDVYKGSKPVPLPPGHQLYADGFISDIMKLLSVDEKEILNEILSKLILLVTIRMEDDPNMRDMWAPSKDKNYCCNTCGLNHEARDFFRATLMALIDEFEQSQRYMDFLFERKMLTEPAHIRLKLERKRE